MVYQEYYPMLERFIIQNSGSAADAKDVFQDLMVILLDKTASGNFELTASLKTYIFSIGRNLWLKKLREKKAIHVYTDVHAEASPEENMIQKEISTGLLVKLGRALHSMTSHCKTLLISMFFKKKRIENIVEERGYKNIHTAQNQQYKCLEQARKELKK